MDNAYYILAKKQIEIERLHICTWEFPNDSSYIEFGMEFSYDSFEANSLEMFLAGPFVAKHEVFCLSENLSNSANGRFIFNDVVAGIDNVGEDSRDGSILRFEKREKLTVLPCNIEIKDGIITFVINKPNKHEGNLYFRVLIKFEKKETVAIKKFGIAQTTYIYDFKINETRNLPQNIYKFKNEHYLEICKVKSVFCLHAIPDNFAFSFVDSSKLKSIRKLETLAFQQYLPKIKGISKDCCNIMFLKDRDKDSYSLFSICNEETIGSRQIALAVGANILCNLLFAISTLRFVKDSTIEWYRQIPLEYYGAFVILILLCIYLFTPLKRKF
ncbi:MAG: hypothetical protein UD103_01030 [Bacteroidales bacterium]|nr:hypothetical protein [Bacteroidales bacterium]